MKLGGKLTDERVAALIGKIYDAAGDAEQWPGAIKGLCEIVEAQSGVIWIKDLTSQSVPLCLTFNQDPRTPSLYGQYYHLHDVWFSACAHMPVGGTFNGEERVAWGDLTRTEFYNDFLKPFDLDRIVTTRLVKSERRVSHCSLFRPARRDSFEADEMRLLATLSPHLGRAVNLHLRLISAGEEQRITEVALDAMAIGVVIVSRSGHPAFANRSAREILQRRDGVQLSTIGLCCVQPTETTELRNKIRSTTEIAHGRPCVDSPTMAVSRISGRCPYIVTIAPVRGVALDLLGGSGTAIELVVLVQRHLSPQLRLQRE
jgi:hypothetical protein